MKTLLNIILTLFVFMLLTACEKTLSDVDFGGTEHKIVVNALAYANEPLRINLSKSLGILENENTDVTLKNAQASVVNSNNESFTFIYDSLGYYHSDLVLQDDETFSVQIRNDGFKTVSSTIKMPSKIEIISIDTVVKNEVQVGCEYCGSSSHLTTTIHLNAHTSEKTYFMVSIISTDSIFTDYYYDDLTGEYTEYELDEPRVYRNKEWIYSLSPSVRLAQDEYYINEVLNDGYTPQGTNLYFEKPKGQQTISVTIHDQGFYLGGSKNPMFVFVVTAITEDYFTYQLSLARAEYAEYDFLAEKVSIYTNISNGLGILGGAYSTQKNIDFSNFKEEEKVN